MIDASNQVIQGFWHGPLTTMERLSMQSFLNQGCEFHLYAYSDLENVPSGVVVKDANEIVPESRVQSFRCSTHFSDFFRVALLLQRGGWNTDLDNILLKSLGFTDSAYCFYRDQEESTISLALSKAPIGSPLMRHLYDYIGGMKQEERDQLSWQAIGPDLTHGAIDYFGLSAFAQPGYVFDPVHWSRAKELVDPAAKWDLSRSRSVHLFHAAWNDGPQDRLGRGWDLGQPSSKRIDTDGSYHPDCLYERLKRKIFDGDDTVEL